MSLVASGNLLGHRNNLCLGNINCFTLLWIITRNAEWVISFYKPTVLFLYKSKACTTLEMDFLHVLVFETKMCIHVCKSA